MLISLEEPTRAMVSEAPGADFPWILQHRRPPHRELRGAMGGDRFVWVAGRKPSLGGTFPWASPRASLCPWNRDKNVAPTGPPVCGHTPRLPSPGGTLDAVTVGAYPWQLK